MKGYLSQLARNTGLNFATGGTTSAVSSSTSRTASAQIEGHEEISAPHVEEVSFPGPSQMTLDTAERSNEDVAGHTRIETISAKDNEIRSEGSGDRGDALQSEFRDVNRERESKTLQSTGKEFSAEATFGGLPVHGTGSKSNAAAGDEYSDDGYPEESPSRGIKAPTFVISEESAATAQTSGSKELFERVEAFADRYAKPDYELRDPLDQNPSTRRLEVEGQEPMQSTKTGERIAAGLEELTEQEVIVRNYLKEVWDWVAAPPDTADVELEFRTSGENQTDRDRPGSEPGTNAAPPRRTSAGPELQDLSLSIGTISIVIEAPTKEAPVTQTLPPKTERVIGRTTTGSTDLSRYYLRRW